MIESKVLVVDDSPAVLETLVVSLERLGIPSENLLRAASAAAARSTFKEHQPPIVFIDVDLAGEKGDEVAKEILAAAPRTRLILMTGMDRRHERIRSVVSAGAFEVLEKPLRLATIKKTLELIELEQKGLRRI